MSMGLKTTVYSLLIKGTCQASQKPFLKKFQNKRQKRKCKMNVQIKAKKMR